MASKSHPGAFYYAHPASKRTQAHPPKTMSLGLVETQPGGPPKMDQMDVPRPPRPLGTKNKCESMEIMG